MRSRPTLTNAIATCVALLAALFVLVRPRTAWGQTAPPPETLQAPAGGRPIAVATGNEARVVCPPPGGAGLNGWTIERDGHALRPPPAAEDTVGRRTVVRVAASTAACATAGTPVTLIAVGPLPALDAAASTIWVDEGRFELHGKRIDGVRVRWRAAGRRGEDVCETKGAASCTLATGRGLTADPTTLSLDWAPGGGVTDDGTVTFDADGRRLGDAETRISPGRIVITNLFPTPANVDLTSAGARMALVHPEAVASVDCAPASCRVDGGALVFQGVTQAGSTLNVKTKLLPRVTMTKGNAFDATPAAEVSLLRCPMSVVGAPPLRNIDDARLVVRLEGNCAREARSLRVFADDKPADTLQVETDKDTAHILVRVGRLEGTQVTVRANRPEPDRSLIAVANAKTRAAPIVRTTLVLDGSGESIDFIPTNRAAVVHTTPPGEGARLVVLGVAGVYKATDGSIQAQGPAGGFSTIRFAYRAASLPAGLAEANLAILEDPVIHPIREANIPVSLGGKFPIAELQCVDRKGTVHTIPMGVPQHVHHEERDGCRVVLHRERLHPNDGAQRLLLDVNVTRVDGVARTEARLTQPFVLRPAERPSVAWIRGAVAPYDRISVGITHVADESHYVSKSEQPLAPPAAQWTVLTGTSVARLYLTAAIPTVLYRVADREHSGVLSLNFGVIARLTWLDSQGTEGFLALEGGVTGVGLAPVVDSTTNQRQVATVIGVGLGVPVANRSLTAQASINLHAWLSYEISRDLAGGPGSAIGFLFGPSISIGNIGTNL